ncbi:MAG: peptidoglycan bridge formation glycyltransferase FemA/FemB family protein, partial [Nitrospira sp.]|nr:peptidoglycan bridge formation glycyltransferase FemA/FemB family protein [Nitrospira sp.]
MSQFTFRTSTCSDAEWDALVVGNPDPHPEQTCAWGEAQRAAGWSAFRILMYENGDLVGGAQILERPIRRLTRVAYLNRGPLLARDGSAYRAALVGELLRVIKARRCLYLALVLPYGGEAFVDELNRCGFVVRPSRLPPVRAMTDTALVDLNPSLDDIMASMRASTRRNIRNGIKRGLKVRLGGEGELPVFDGLLDQLCLRRGARRNIPRGSFLPSLWSGLSRLNGIQLFLATHGETPVAAVMTLTLGKTARDWRVGWNGEHSDKYPNELLRWEVIRWAKEKGFRSYDFCGIDSALARRVLAGAELSAEESTGPSFFKLGFGARPKLLSPDFCFFPNPLVRGMVRRWGSR